MWQRWSVCPWCSSEPGLGARNMFSKTQGAASGAGGLGRGALGNSCRGLPRKCGNTPCGSSLPPPAAEAHGFVATSLTSSSPNPARTDRKFSRSQDTRRAHPPASLSASGGDAPGSARSSNASPAPGRELGARPGVQRPLTLLMSPSGGGTWGNR